jgi:hypothetical protein
LELALQALLALAQRRHSSAQLVQGKQVFLVGRKQPVHALMDLRQIPSEAFLLALCRTRIARRFKAPVQFGLDEGRVLQQVHNLGPHEVLAP